MLSRRTHPRLVVSAASGPDVALGVVWPHGYATELPGQQSLAHLLEHLLAEDSLVDGEGVREVLFSHGIEVEANTHPFHTELTLLAHRDDLTAAEGIVDEVLARWIDPRAFDLDEQMVASSVASIRAEVAQRLPRTGGRSPWWAWVPSSFSRVSAPGHDGFADLSVVDSRGACELVDAYRRSTWSVGRVASLVGPMDDPVVVRLVELLEGLLDERRPDLATDWLRDPVEGPALSDDASDQGGTLVVRIGGDDEPSVPDEAERARRVALARTAAAALSRPGATSWRAGVFQMAVAPESTVLLAPEAGPGRPDTSGLTSLDASGLDTLLAQGKGLVAQGLLSPARRARTLARGLVCGLDPVDLLTTFDDITLDDLAALADGWDDLPSALVRPPAIRDGAVRPSTRTTREECLL